MLDVEKIKKDFPIFQRKINEKPIVYLDSGSTSQKPFQVIEAVKNFYENYNSNIHRSVYKISEEATEEYEGSREKIRKFLDAKDYEIIFTKSCTESINLVSNGWGWKNVGENDSVLLSVAEHHSNIVPWQKLRQKGAKVDFLDIDKEGNLKFELKKSDRIVSLSHISNVLGIVNDVKEIAKKCRDNGSLFMIDGAQSVPHMKISLKDIGCDFLALSSHKMLGPTGVGILAVRKEIAEEMDPLLLGSDMIKEVTMEKTTFADPPAKFETGTPNIAGVIGLSAAIEYLENIGIKKIEDHEKEMSRYSIEKLSEIEGLEIYGPKKKESGLVSFNLKGIHSHDVATITSENNVCIRSGHMCAQLLMKKFNTTSMARTSSYIYNDKNDIDCLAEGLSKAVEVFKK